MTQRRRSRKYSLANSPINSAMGILTQLFTGAMRQQRQIDKEVAEIKGRLILNDQRLEDIKLKQQRQIELDQKIIRLQNQIALQELQILAQRRAMGLEDTRTEFIPDDYDFG